jgi:hypothetical protein
MRFGKMIQVPVQTAIEMQIEKSRFLGRSGQVCVFSQNFVQPGRARPGWPYHDERRKNQAIVGYLSPRDESWPVGTTVSVAS